MAIIAKRVFSGPLTCSRFQGTDVTEGPMLQATHVICEIVIYLILESLIYIYIIFLETQLHEILHFRLYVSPVPLAQTTKLFIFMPPYEVM